MAESVPGAGHIVVTVSSEHELEADHVDAIVDVRATAFFTGGAALTNAKEVLALVRRLEELGVSKDAFSLEAVHAEMNEGLLTRSSSAVYTLRIRLDALERVADVLGAFTGLKQATLRELRWGYARETEAREAWLEELARAALRQARRVADGLGARLGGTSRFAEKVTVVQAPVAHGAYDAGAIKSRSYGGGRPDLGFTVAHRKRMLVEATVEFHTLPAAS
ncbi:SIMPL domain-containing protein [Corallococcus sp. M34]|uniref:SIMPL domain-containing protein n=1 Tax=Citreicoccus inhibens TaxID=2849499 RepID=UPI0013154F31|nr:SIMPL domain-containing protein [Citreicoccus inhibens]MBU8894219.1 SIMPL domain-containing protein [Citreicoccus inhibens]